MTEAADCGNHSLPLLRFEMTRAYASDASAACIFRDAIRFMDLTEQTQTTMVRTSAAGWER